ncbi:MAG: hypothetical protein IT288_17335 [Bdellovibrionales bacterium]|nr:hypothetical protein [Bdellovibrionales bacterium]
MRWHLRSLLISMFFLASTSALSAEKIAGAGSRFPGFKKGDYGWGGVIGQPFAGRYQRWMDWKRAWFADVGYQIDEFFVAHANYAHYLINEDDRWKMDRRVGTALTNVFGGVVASAYLGDKPEEKSQLGIRVGGAFEYLVPKTGWSVRLEVAPVLYLSGRTAGGLEGGIVFIYYKDPVTGKAALKDYSGEAAAPAGGVTKEMLSGEEDFKDFEEEPDKKAAADEEEPKKKTKKKKPKKKKSKKKKAAPKDDSYRIEKFEESEESSDEDVEF